jgi:hypothetical protein
MIQIQDQNIEKNRVFPQRAIRVGHKSITTRCGGQNESIFETNFKY